MGQTIPLGRNFDGGMVSDVSRDELAPNQAYRMYDFIPQLEAPVRGRGGWAYGSPDLQGVGGGAASVSSLGFLPFPADGQLAVVSDSGSVYQLKRFDGSGGAVVTDSGDTTIVPTWPVFYCAISTTPMGIILPSILGTAQAPKKYYDTGSLSYAVAALGGTPPKARWGFTWGSSYLVLGNYYNHAGTLYNDHIVFSNAGAPETWTYGTTDANNFDSNVGFPEEVVAGIGLTNGIMVWGYNNVHLITGTTPPPGGDFSTRILFAGNGTFDGRTAQPWRDYAVWANSSGIWKSDGSTLTDLTATAGISVFYRQQVSGFAFKDGWTAVAGVYRDHYILTIRDGDGALVNTFVIDLSRNVAHLWTNISSALFAAHSAGPGTTLYGGDEELFFGHTSLPRVGKISTLWTPGSSYKNDADSTPVLPELETPYYTVGTEAPKRFRRAFFTYSLQGSATPRLEVEHTVDPAVGSSYTDPGTRLNATTAIERSVLDIRKAGIGIAFKVVLTGAANNLAIYGMEIDAHPQEGTRHQGSAITPSGGGED